MLLRGGGILVLISVLAAGAGAPFLAAGPQQENPERAKKLWELAITAKGGRERLYKVEKLLRSYGTKHKEVFFYVFPNKFWLWADNRPSLLGLGVHMYNLERRVGYGVHKVPGKPLNGPTELDLRAGEEHLFLAQVEYLMETRWVKPVPYDAREEVFNGRPVDAVYARANGEKICYLLDKSTHLPKGYREYYADQGRENSWTVRFDQYIEVGGIHFPGKIQAVAPGWFSQTYQVNVEYDHQLFEQPPSIEAGPDAWRPKPQTPVGNKPKP